MTTKSVKVHIYQLVICSVLVGILSGCEMPMRPEGIDIQGMTQIADKLRAQGDDQAAVNFYQRALQRAPSDAHARKALAEILEAHGNLDEAARQYGEGLDHNPQNTDLMKGYARCLLKQGHLDAARDQYEHVLRNNDEDIKALNGLGVTLDQLGNHTAAQQTYQNALEVDADDVATLANLGHSYVMTGAYDQAIKLLEPHVSEKTSTAALRQNLAEAYGMEGMEVDAERVGRMDLNEHDVKYNLAYYRNQRARLALVPSLYADLGHFGTEALAQADADELARTFPRETEGLVIRVESGIKSSGATPTFSVTASGFARPDRLRSFCDHLKKADHVCTRHGA